MSESLEMPATDKDDEGDIELPSEERIFNFLLSSARKRNLSNDQYRLVAKYYEKQLCGEDSGTIKELHEEVQNLQANNQANYNHICHIIKKLKTWKEAGIVAGR